MTQDDTVVVDPVEPQDPVDPVDPQDPIDPQDPVDPQEDYRGKLNATNSFLKKEGYTFDEAKKQWVKPAPAAKPPKNGNDLSNEDGERIARAEDRSERAALRSLGITHADDIKYVRDAANRLGIDVEEAAEDEFVKSKLDRMQAARKSKEATPDPSRRGGSTRNTKLPDFSKMSNAEFDKWEKENR